MWEVLGGLFVWTMIGGVIPVINTELMVVVTAVTLSSQGAPLVVAVATLGQMITKTSLFFLARWAPSRLPEKACGALDRGHDWIERHGGATGSLIFLSAALGLPPFYAISLAAGALDVRWPLFVGLGTLGRAIRFGALAWAGLHFGEEALQLFT